MPDWISGKLPLLLKLPQSRTSDPFVSQRCRVLPDWSPEYSTIHMYNVTDSILCFLTCRVRWTWLPTNDQLWYACVWILNSSKAPPFSVFIKGPSCLWKSLLTTLTKDLSSSSWKSCFCKSACVLTLTPYSVSCVYAFIYSMSSRLPNSSLQQLEAAAHWRCSTFWGQRHLPLHQSSRPWVLPAVPG